MGQDTSEIRAEIDETCARMGDTVEALGYKTDVKGRTRGYLADKRDTVVGRADDLVSRARGVAPSPDQAKEAGKRAAGKAQQNPFGLAAASAAVGFLVGMAAPKTRVEDEKMGSVADDLKERVKETSQEAFERGKDVAQEAAQSAMETAKERGREEGEQLSSTARENAQAVASEARDTAQEQVRPGGSTGTA